MSHFTDFELHRWRDAGPGPDRPRVVEHLAACPDCASRYAAALRTRPLQGEPAQDVGDFAAAGLRVPAGRRLSMPLLAAAAAALIVIISVPLALRRRPEPPVELHFRGSGIHALTPGGAVDRNNLEFVWASGIAAGHYVVQIGEGDRVIFTASTTASRMTIASDRLKPGVSYWWTVTAVAAGGQPLASSPRRPFLVRQ